MAKLDGHEGSVACLAVLDGGRLASGSADTTVKIWQIAAGACVVTLRGHRSFVECIAVIEDGTNSKFIIRYYEITESGLGRTKLLAD